MLFRKLRVIHPHNSPIPMNKAQAAYNLLLMLSVVDGSIDERERQVIQLYVQQNFPDEAIDFFFEETLLASMTPEQLMEEFKTSLSAYFRLGSVEDRVSLMLTGMDVVMADGVMSTPEETVFKTLAASWGLKYEALVAHHTQRNQQRAREESKA